MSPASARPVGIGVLGCGAIATWAHLPALSRLPSFDIVGAADPDPGARSRAARWTRTLCATLDELLALPRLEAVVVTVPPYLHADVVEQACAAGKHVYLEKPLAVDRSAAERIVRAAARSGVTVAMGFNRRLHPTLQRARSAVRSGLIGRVRAVQSRFCEMTGPHGLPEWKRSRAAGGGALLDLGTHHVDLVRWLVGEEVVSATARLASDVSEHDSAWVRWTLSGGTEAQGFFSYRTATEDRLELCGERGVVRVNRHRFTLSIELTRPGRYGTRRRTVLPAGGELLGRWAHAVGHVYEPSYRRSLKAFAELLRGRRADLATLEDGLRALEAVLQAEA